ncbi:DUF429 domain-containing protein [Actinomadura viridis]|uniref:RNase H-like nuclease n=1 Tax=Actinomadura viridis TaxID=58110 RepID=A0A931DMU5_9ACTN|nr:DUF429 domain-containing protein [Actinomadura viridis]MBG6092860.1 putative RNase H-like nuclease [Actinomadura viridis]
MTERVLGVDACAAGWVGMALDEAVTPYFAPRIHELVDAAAPVTVVAIDIPIGLADNGLRQADLLARQELGRRRSTLFMTPVRRALEAGTHAQATEINRRLTGKGVSIQAFALKPKILEVDRWVRRNPPYRVVEVHPELSFARMSGAPVPPKTTWAGAETRRRLLAGEGIHLTGDLGPAGANARVDDVLDAAAAAWTARRVARDQARCLPAPPETFTDRHPCAIWT